MSEEAKETQQLENTHPEDNGAKKSGATFTQDDVNRIVSERLARERDKIAKEQMQQDPAEQRERALSARESALDCREYVREKGYPAALLDVLDTSNTENFKTQVEKLLELFPGLDPSVDDKTPIAVRGTSAKTGGGDPIAEAFKHK